ncbi:LLM class flavin-dependent oxidoreductase [Streptomyces flaveolus]|uniref:LLM class flavin-dependent oxidoreductase n=1 Tax=Streptomyces flaveolus TaxID=67297 RepID=UPI0036C2FEC5
MAASGPRNLRLAGEEAGGVILLSGVSPHSLASATARVRDGERAAGRAPESVRLTVSAYCEVTDDIEAAARRIKPICAAITRNGGAPFLALAGIHVDVPAVPDVIDGVYPDLAHAEDWDAAVKAVSPWVDDAAALRFAEEFCLFGTADDTARRLRALHADDVDGVFLQHVGSYAPPIDLIESVGASVLPAL